MKLQQTSQQTGNWQTTNWRTIGRRILQTLPFLLPIVAISTIGYQPAASAQPAYGSYVGAGPAFGLTSEVDGQKRKVGAFIAGRYKFLKSPVSIRTQAFIRDGVTVVPTVSYDYPINWQTDLYLGAGASIPLGDDSGLGSRTGFALQPGIDYALPNSDFVIFSNAVISIGGYRDKGAAAALQAGVGLRF